MYLIKGRPEHGHGSIWNPEQNLESLTEFFGNLSLSLLRAGERGSLSILLEGVVIEASEQIDRPFRFCGVGLPFVVSLLFLEWNNRN